MRRATQSHSSKLDRILVCNEMDEILSNPGVKALARLTSDHTPLFLEPTVKKARCIPIKFYHSWIMVPGFMELIEKWWKEQDVSEFPSYQVWLNFKNLKEELKVWNG